MDNSELRIDRAIYCQVKDLLAITDPADFQDRFSVLQRQYPLNKIYLELYRHGQTLETGYFESLAAFFRREGLKIAVGLTTDEPENNQGGFDTLCYTDKESRDILGQAVRTAATLADELLIDDFLFTNCRCPRCISAKGELSWPAFRTQLLRSMLEEIILPEAKAVNPKIHVILKYPNWYHGYNSLGYSLQATEDNQLSRYAGAETRNPQYTQQHLPKYLSYLICRLLDSEKLPLKGAWVDPYETTGNWSYFSGQIELALFAKSPEITLFSLGDLLEPRYSLALPIAGEVIRRIDAVLPLLGKATGLAAYVPEGGIGEDYLLGHVGSVGIALEPHTTWPADEPAILVTAASSADPKILDHIETALIAGKDVTITSGFLHAIRGQSCPAADGGTRPVNSGHAFRNRFADIYCEGNGFSCQQFAYSEDGGITFIGMTESRMRFSFPKIHFQNNDSWELVAGFEHRSSCPLFLKTEYGTGKLYVWTIPENPGLLANLPKEVLNPIRAALTTDAPVLLKGSGDIMLFTYDNDVFILYSLLPRMEIVNVELRHGYTALQNVETGEIHSAVKLNGQPEVKLSVTPCVSQVYRLVHHETSALPGPAADGAYTNGVPSNASNFYASGRSSIS